MCHPCIHIRMNPSIHSCLHTYMYINTLTYRHVPCPPPRPPPPPTATTTSSPGNWGMLGLSGSIAVLLLLLLLQPFEPSQQGSQQVLCAWCTHILSTNDVSPFPSPTLFLTSRFFSFFFSLQMGAFDCRCVSLVWAIWRSCHTAARHANIYLDARL